LFACSELYPSAWMGEDAIKVFIELALKLFPRFNGVGT
jgi:DNA-binding transcriptional regulator PaaX